MPATATTIAPTKKPLKVRMSSSTNMPGLLTTSMENQLILVRRTLALKEQLKRIRQEREKAQLCHDEQCARASDRIAFLQTRLDQQQSSMRSNSNLTVYRRALSEAYNTPENKNDNVPPRYVLEQQAKLLSYFHLTEVYRNQWDLLATIMIRTTRFMMYEASVLRDEKTLAETMLHAATPTNEPCKDDVPRKDSMKRSRRGSLLLLGGGVAARHNAILTLSSAIKTWTSKLTMLPSKSKSSVMPLPNILVTAVA